MNATRHILAAAAATALLAPGEVNAGTSFTPSAFAGGRATDNAGDRPEALATRSDMTATTAVGGRLVVSRPIWSIRVEGLGEYERYLSAGVRNTLATGGLDGKWRPDERTYVRSLARASYAPNRFDPRVPYRVALAAPAGEEMPAFVQATTTRWSEHVFLDHRATEIARMRGSAGLSSTRYGERRLAGPGGSRINADLLQSRLVAEVSGESLWKTGETAEAGLFAEGARADYETSSDVWTAGSGGVLEWNAAERTTLRARAGATWMTVPGDETLPDRLGYTGELAFVRRWQLAEIELVGREGHYLADATIPAARRREGRLTVRANPLERLSLDAWGGGGWERSQYAAYHATGTAQMRSAGAGAGWRVTEHLTARAGFEHTRLDATGRVAMPFESNTFHLGFSFGGWSVGSPAPEAVP